MPSIPDLEKPPRRVLNIFYVLDTSGSMIDTPIAQLNSAMAETIEILKKQAKSNADAQLKISVLEFNSNPRWLQPNGPELMEDFIWEDLEAGGMTNIGAALTELDSKLSRNAFLQSMTGAYQPVLIFMTDGYATDDYSNALARIRQNKWFSRATKIGFAIGDADMKMISEVVGTHEAVIRTDDLKLFGKLIRFASVTASMLASTSRTTAQEVTGASIVKAAIDSGEADSSVVVEPEINYDPEPVPPPDDDLDEEWA